MIKGFLILSLLFIFAPIYSQSRVGDIVSNDSSIETTVSELKKIVETGRNTEEKYEAALVLAQLQEQFGEYTDASLYYTTAASLIGTQSAKGQELLLGAVRCALLIGDVSRADFLLSTALSSITDTEAKAKANLYAVWSWVIKAENEDELDGPISVLNSYVTLESMKSVRPSLLLTLHHLTGEKAWSDQLEKEYPHSPETAVVQGKAQLMPTPFWFFSTLKD